MEICKITHGKCTGDKCELMGHYSHGWRNCTITAGDVSNYQKYLTWVRDSAAIHALGGMLAHARHGHGYHPCHDLPWKDDIAVEAYELADAMMKAREDETT